MAINDVTKALAKMGHIAKFAVSAKRRGKASTPISILRKQAETKASDYVFYVGIGGDDYQKKVDKSGIDVADLGNKGADLGIDVADLGNQGGGMGVMWG